MATSRKKGSLRQTTLCAIKLKMGEYRGHPFQGNRNFTFNAPVRKTIREQGFTPSEIDAEYRKLEKAGLIETFSAPYTHRKSVKLTAKGLRASKCKTVRLSPFTDEGYMGNRLEGLGKPTGTVVRRSYGHVYLVEMDECCKGKKCKTFDLAVQAHSAKEAGLKAGRQVGRKKGCTRQVVGINKSNRARGGVAKKTALRGLEGLGGQCRVTRGKNKGRFTKCR